MSGETLIEMRKNAVRGISAAEDKAHYIEQNADTLFSLDLTMYSGNATLNSLFYNAIASSKLDSNISLHPDQYKALKLLEKNQGLILSAPTSFGKTYVVFEYIARFLPETVFLVVPTLALIDEYKKKIINTHKHIFGRYKVFTSINNEMNYSEFDYKMFIVTHDRVLEETSFDTIDKIDLLVIDEVYKLDTRGNDDRKLILNFAYYYLVQKSEKHILLAPFISGVDNIKQLEKRPVFFSSEFSPVVNEVVECPIYTDTIEERFKETNKILLSLPVQSRTLVYFANASDIPKYVNLYRNTKYDDTQISSNTANFIDWMSNEIHPNWYVVKAMKRGFLVHCGELQLGIRNMELDIFEEESEPHNTMLCTSTLLEGVNTSTENIIITKPCRSYGYNYSNDFEAFDFFNLVGRSGRLFKTNLGKAFYIKSPTDKSFSINDAIKSIEFEITSNSVDVQIQKKECTDTEYLDFLRVLGCSEEEYLGVVGYTRLEKVKSLYQAYKVHKRLLLPAIDLLINRPETTSKAIVIYRLLHIITCSKEEKFNPYLNYKSGIINLVINRNRYKVRQIVDETIGNLGTYNRTLDQVIAEVIKVKNSYVEYEFSKHLNIILFFMKQDSVDHKYIDYLVSNVVNNIGYLYYKNDPIKRILKESGVYERDIDTIYEYVKNCGEDIKLLRELLKTNYPNYKDKVSFLTKYSIGRM